MDNDITKPLCFVIMGFGEKPDYPRNRKIDLDKTYQNIIKPAADLAGFNCIRADEIKHSGLIDVPMYRNLYEAELVVADISTLNANAIYELGIRHGIRPFSTIILAQEKEDIPFDTNHVRIFRYEHLGKDIGCTEALRCKEELAELMIKVTENPEIDSPFYINLGISTLNELKIEKNTQQSSYSVQDSKAIACLALIGRWNDNNTNDREIIKDTLGVTDSDFLDFTKISKDSNSPLQLTNTRWSLNRTEDVLQLFCKYNSCQLLTKFKESAIIILSELNPKFDLEKDQRFMASYLGKNCKYSKDLQIGISEALVWLAIHQETLLIGPNKYLVDQIVFNILNNSDWHLWASLNELLPILAEASPSSFLRALQEQITKHSDLVVELFKQEGDGLINGSLITGILWSLETIAWIPECFQQVVITLAELSRLDIGGKCTNRPINSLKTILLAWINTTTAKADDKITAVKILKDSYPDIAWRIVFSLLPSMNSTSFGCREPHYRTSLLSTFDKTVLYDDYVKQITEYSKFAIELMKQDFNRIYTILNNLNAIKPDYHGDIFSYLDSLDYKNISRDDVFLLWEQVEELIRKHKRFKNSKWAYNSTTIKWIESFAEKIKPEDKKLLYRHLFTAPYYELSDSVYKKGEETDWDRVQKKVEEKRKNALDELINQFGLDVISDFIVDEKIISSIAPVLERKQSKEVDNYLIPKYLDSENAYMNLLCKSYINCASYNRGKNWFSDLNIEQFDVTKKVIFLTCLKFEEDTWKLVSELLGENDSLYWKSVNQNIYASNSNFNIAVSSFNKVNRYQESSRCIYVSIINKVPVDVDLIYATLSCYSNVDTDNVEIYELKEIIKYLESIAFDKGKLWQIEWKYYSLFVFDDEDIPQTLYRELSTNPKLYVDLLKLGFIADDCKEKKEFSEEEQAVAQNAWHILDNFKLLPGLDKSGFLNSDILNSWVNEVIKFAVDEKRSPVAKIYLGHLLFHAPADRDGFWIDREVAKILNTYNNADMLKGYNSECINSRGCYIVDTTGKTENDLGDKWSKRADELREQHFYLFANEAESIARFFYDSALNSQKMTGSSDKGTE